MRYGEIELGLERASRSDAPAMVRARHIQAGGRDRNVGRIAASKLQVQAESVCDETHDSEFERVAVTVLNLSHDRSLDAGHARDLRLSQFQLATSPSYESADE
jgi:hypothetical protein